MSNKLILALDGEILREYNIERDFMSIGRKHENDIQLNDLTVSGRHALISKVGDHVYIEDLNSTNGTLVNGNYVSKFALQHGNVIQIGHYLFTFFNDDKETYEPTMFIKAELDDTQVVLPEWEMNERAINMRGQPLGALRKLHDPVSSVGIEMRKPFSTIGFEGKKLALINRGAKGYSIVAIKQDASRKTAEIPRLNGKEIGPSAVTLHEHDIISIAGIDMEFYYIN
ncbi:MAG: FHA domain-containing protein [Gammaproteobacteria bacterium]|nr:FHA domain-containing protein [Gammaproteobacteria bacterium]